MLCYASPPPNPQSLIHNRSHNEMRVAFSLLRPASIRSLPLLRKTPTTPNPYLVRSPVHRFRLTTMASAHKPEDARVPPAVELPTPPVTKVPYSSHTNLVLLPMISLIIIALPNNFQFKIALCQLSVTTDKERNIQHARKAIEEAAGKGAQLVVLPVSRVACN